MGSFDDHENDPPKISHKYPYDLNSKIMLTAIFSLSFVLILVLLLHIYARCALRRQARRRSIIRSLDLVSNRAIHSTEPPKTGLDPAVIVALPLFIFHRADGHDEAATIECAVCLSTLEDGELVRLLPNCKHTFHAECINKWLGSHPTCPICRTEAEPRLQPEPREYPVSVEAAPTAPLLVFAEGTSNNNNSVEASAKITGSSSSRLHSFRRMLSGERSSRRVQVQEEIFDLERQ